jgi:hypothetical protein
MKDVFGWLGVWAVSFAGIYLAAVAPWVVLLKIGAGALLLVGCYLVGNEIGRLHIR